MLKIGITGGIGSGKTTVCRVFETLGIPVFNADVVAKQIMVTDTILIAEIKLAFGEDSYLKNEALNNKHLAEIVFNDTKALAKLNSIVHPAVFRAFETWVKEIPTSVPYVLKEAALLFESGSYQMCNYNILVTAPLTTKLARVMQRDGVTEAQVKARMDKQFTDKQKLKMADYFIENTENRSVITQVLDLHQQFLNL
ncbi:MAG: dephospho-CoA kinase [Sphingobacteriaceae bacterium]|jgi:dephospho-CoA kinase|nr:dephospho-CoA kinase [Sphingobacteriaceae bacterium]